MKWKTTKKLPPDALAGIKFTFEELDGSVNSVILEDKDGKRVRFGVGSYSFQMATPAPPVTVTRYRVVGTAGEGEKQVAITSRSFAHQNEAQEHRYKLEDLYRDAKLKEAAVEMLETEVEAEEGLPSGNPAIPF